MLLACSGIVTDRRLCRDKKKVRVVHSRREWRQENRARSLIGSSAQLLSSPCSVSPARTALLVALRLRVHK